jgi:hypothetical protein
LIEIHPGDIACTRYPGDLGDAITTIEAFYEDDNSGAEYSHALLFQSPSETFESLEIVTSRKWPDDFEGAKVLIGRHERMDNFAFDYGFGLTRTRRGEAYPYYRLLLHLFNLGQICAGSRLVCSELVTEILWHCGLIWDWRGKTPDWIADEIKGGPPWAVVWEGVVSNGLESVV